MAQAALTAPVIPGRAQWQGEAAPANLPRFVVSRLAATAWAALGAAIGLWGFLGGQAFSLNPAFWAMVAVFVGIPVVGGVSRLLMDRPAPVERYTLTDRFFVVQSQRGCHAYDLATLQDVSVEQSAGQGRLILRRHPDVSRELGLLMRFTAWANRQDMRVVLADRLEDAPGLLQRIRAAQEVLSQAAQTDGSPPPADGVSIIATDIPQSISYNWQSLMAAGTAGVVLVMFLGMPIGGQAIPMVVMLLTFGLFGAGYLWNGLRLRERGLLRRGVCVMGEVTDIEQTDVRADDWRVRYRYPISGGGTVSGELKRSTFAEIERWAVGDLIEVRYDPARPDRHLVRGDA
jgi:hypothetical protein